MLSVHWRMAELWTLQQSRKLTQEEESELSICLQYNAMFARRLASLHNMSLAASMTHDSEWQHEICAQIENLERQYGWGSYPGIHQ